LYKTDDRLFSPKHVAILSEENKCCVVLQSIVLSV